MSDETYYTVLNVKETASASEIKTAYRDLIKQVHPDTITNLAPYLRKIAEDKAKEITEAYTVLSNASKRRDYDRQLAAYRHQNAPQATPTPQPTPPPQQPSQCPICGRSDGGHSAACVNYRTSQGTPATPSATTAKPTATPKVIRRFGYNWGPILDWAGEHPIIVVFLFVLAVFSIGAFFSDTNTPQPSASSSSASPTPSTNNTKVASTGPYSAYPCDFREKVSSIDGKPCSERRDQSVPARPPGFTVVSEEPAPSKATVTVSGTYLGTVHNKIANLSSTVAAVFRQSKAGVLEGCMKVKPPLYGSGTVQGTVRGAYVNFAVADITFHGDALKNSISGSYVVSRQDGQQLGDFRIEKRKEGDPQYYCKDGTLTEVQPEVTARQPKVAAGTPEDSKPTEQPEVIVVPREKPKSQPEVVVVPRETVIVVVTSDYAAIVKRCAFLPADNYARCGYQPQTIAKPRKHDRLTVLSPLTRAENGEDIYKVRTEQGWEGWIDSKFVQIQD